MNVCIQILRSMQTVQCFPIMDIGGKSRCSIGEEQFAMAGCEGSCRREINGIWRYFSRKNISKKSVILKKLKRAETFTANFIKFPGARGNSAFPGSYYLTESENLIFTCQVCFAKA